MDFIERLFNVAPDGGSGTLELLLLLVPMAIAYRAFRKFRPSRRSGID